MKALLKRSGDTYNGKGISIIIPVRGKDRVPYVKKVIENIKAQNYEPYEIVITEEIAPNDKKSFFKNTKHTFKSRVGIELFNKSAVMNKGFTAARYDICMLLDADILLPKNYLIEVEKHIEDHDMCYLLKRLKYTKHRPHQITPDKKLGVSYIRDDNFNGGSFAITKKAYKKIGGMCEKFIGYGYEDLEFWDRAKKLLKVNEHRIFDAIHIDHDHASGYDKHWKANQDLWHKLHGIPAKDRAKKFKKEYLKV